MYARIDPISGAVIQFPYEIRQLKQENPNTSFPSKLTAAGLAGFNVVEVTVRQKPQINPDIQRVQLSTTVERQGNSYSVGWDVVERSPADKAAIAKKKAQEKFDAAERGNLSVGEKLAVLSLYDEYQRYKMDNTAPTPQLNDIKTYVYPQLTIDQIGAAIEGRALPYLKAAAVAWATKVQEGA